VGKTTKSDEPKQPKKGPKALGPATVLKPVLIGAALLAAVQAVLPKVL
jgi:hypothetical protein